VSPRRSGQIGGTVEDWGVAFEGLPLDAKLYPAVGLYQRDDRVTLLSVEAPGVQGSVNGMTEVSGGECYFPRPGFAFDKLGVSDYTSGVRLFNDLLTWDGIRYAAETLHHATEALRDKDADNFILRNLLPSLGAALCLLPPSVPMLSARCALSLIPHLSRCILELGHLLTERQRIRSLFQRGVIDGKWIIRATGSTGTSAGFEEYIVDFKTTGKEDGSVVGIEGSGIGTIGKSKNGLVNIIGYVKGSSLSFIEDWSEGVNEQPSRSATEDDASSCVVAARMSMDGRRFEGAYRNVQCGSAGQIVGMLSEKSGAAVERPRNGEATTFTFDETASIEECGALLCLAQSHLTTLLGDDAAGDLEQVSKAPVAVTKEALSKQEALKGYLTRPLLSIASLGPKKSSIEKDVASLTQSYCPPSVVDEIKGIRSDHLLENVRKAEEQLHSTRSGAHVVPPRLAEQVAMLDQIVAPESGGFGSLRSLCPSGYTEARRQIICSLMFHCRFSGQFAKCDDPNKFLPAFRDKVRFVWRAALKIMEDGVRRALSRCEANNSRDRCSEVCELFSQISMFLLSLELGKEAGYYLSVDDVAAELSFFYNLIDHRSDLEYLESQMALASKRGLLRLVSLGQIVRLVNTIDEKNVALIESLVVGIPRQLGRGKPEPTWLLRAVLDDDQRAESVPDVDGSYLSRLSGSNLKVKEALRNQVCALFESLGRVANQAISQRSHSDLSLDYISSNDSLVLTIMTIFVGHMRFDDIDDIVSGSCILSILPKVLSVHRHAILRDTEMDVSDDDMPIACSALREICQRDVSRAILRCAVAAAHVVIYQVTMDRGRDNTEPTCSVACLNLLLDELAITFQFIEQSSLSSMSDVVAKKSEEEWQSWISARFAGKTAGRTGEVGHLRRTKGASCLRYLREHGTMLNNIVHGNHQKQPLSPKGTASGSSRQGMENLSTVSTVFAHQFLSHWLHILCAVLRSRNSLSTATQDRSWLTVLLKGVGLTVEYTANGVVDDVKLRTDNDGILPATFRARLLRLMLPLLSALEPNQVIVEGLLHLAGVASTVVTQSLDDDESFVSRESISVLRQLHSPVHPRWRESINSTIATTADPRTDSTSFYKRIGMLSFFSGSLEMISRGSYVLLKPAASSALPLDHQSSPSSKPHPSGIGGNAMSAPTSGATPHHLVGNGTSSVIAGLCRGEASAGIVSNIDMKNGICEVILVARGQNEANGRESASESKRHRSTAPGRSSLGGRHTLTVRALRTPLADVVHAQEVPLFLDDSIPFETLTSSIFQSSLESLLSAMSLRRIKESPPPLSDDSKSKHATEDTNCEEGKNGNESGEDTNSDCLHKANDVSTETAVSETPVDKLEDSQSLRSGVIGLSSDLMTIRCCIVLLSDKRMLSSFRDFETSKEILSKVLALAWPDDSEVGANASLVHAIRNKGLVHLPNHEAKFGHIVSLLRDLSLRMRVMKQTPDEQRKNRIEYFRSQLKAESSKPSGVMSETAGGKELPSNLARSSTTDHGDTTEARRETEINSSRSISQSTGGSNSDDEEENEAAATAAAHLREAAIAQMAELGLPRSWSELALRRTGGVNIEAAVTFCLERGPEIERLLAEEQEQDRLMQRDASGGSSSRRRENRDTGPPDRFLRQLLEMGFPQRWCTEALAVTGNNVDEALTWILNNGERLSEEDEAIEADGGAEVDNADDAESGDDDDEDETEVDDARSDGELEESREADETQPHSGSAIAKPGWTGSVIPLRFISGRAIVNPVKMEISGLPSGGFSSVGTKGVLLSSGKWYYEAVLETAGCLQIGWADGSFAGHCHADRGDGCGDGPSSWAYDGWRRYRWHATATEWGCRWKEGDVVGCLVDMDERIVSFTLNGYAESIGMGAAFTGEGFRPCGGVYACVSFNRREKLRLILGGSGSEPFKHQPPPGYRGVGEAVLEAVQERDQLLAKEDILEADATNEPAEENSKRFLCDFSDGDHGHELMAWAHRYYGSDASVHLGSVRPKPSTPKTSSSISAVDSKQSLHVTRRLQKAWSEHSLSAALGNDPDYEEIAMSIEAGYDEVQRTMIFELFNECIAIAVLLARKLVLHLLVADGQDFDPKCFTKGENNTLCDALKLWNVIEACTSLRSVGWVGEAGTMAIAAEALGLSISSNDQLQSRSAGERMGLVSASDFDDGHLLPTGGFTQVLTSVLTMKIDSSAVNTCLLAPSSAEAAMGSDGGGGILGFLQEGLQSAVCRSPEFRSVLVAAIRRSVRRLAVVEYDSDDFEASDQKEVRFTH
jgi:SPRY domain/UBA/TS-N domain